MSPLGARPVVRHTGQREAEEPHGPARRLVQVSFRHEYYNAADFRCPALVAEPTATTAALLAGLGMRFRIEDAGFSVVSDLRSETALLSRMMRKTAESPANLPTRTGRLTFLLRSRHPHFANFTDLPTDFSASRATYYLTNRRLTDFGDGAFRLELRPPLPAVAPAARWPVKSVVASVSVLGPGGEQLASVPACPPPVPTGDCPPEVTLDFSRLPEGRYRIRERDRRGRLGRQERVVYAPSAPLAMVDLFLVAREGEDPAAFPVGVRCCGRGVHPVQYEVWFEARRTRWRYVVSGPAAGARPTELRIDGPVPFSGPQPAQLPAGGDASRFVAGEDLPIEQRSGLRLRLLGHKPGMVSEQVLVARLPVADAGAVRLEAGESVSDVYVQL